MFIPPELLVYILNHSLQPPKTKHKHSIRIHATSSIQIFTSIHLSKSNQCNTILPLITESNYGIFCINEPPIYTTTTPQRNPFVHMTIIRFVINKWDVPMHYYELNTINRWIYCTKQHVIVSTLTIIRRWSRIPGPLDPLFHS